MAIAGAFMFIIGYRLINAILSGASGVTGGIAASNVDLYVEGASRAELSGSANDLVLKADGASTARLADFLVKDASVRLSGAGNATVNLTGTLNADLSGGSTLRYICEPRMGTINVSGGSKLVKA